MSQEVENSKFGRRKEHLLLLSIKEGSFHDYGTGEHYVDIVSLLYDGYHAFDSLSNTMKWVCLELNINWEEVDHACA